MDAEVATTRSASDVRDAPGGHDQEPDQRKQNAPGAHAQQPGKSKPTKATPPTGARAKVTKDKTRGKDAARTLAPDVVDAKGQRVPFSRRGWEQQDSEDSEDETTTAPLASRPASLGFPCQSRYDYVIVDNGATKSGALAIGVCARSMMS